MRHEDIDRGMKKYGDRSFKGLRKLLARVQEKIFVSIWLTVNSLQIYGIRDDIRDSELAVLLFAFTASLL